MLSKVETEAVRMDRCAIGKYLRCGAGLPRFLTCSAMPLTHAEETDSAESRVKELEGQLRTLDSEVKNLKAQIQDTKESTAQLSQRVESQGIQARLGDGVFFEDPRGLWSVGLSARGQLDYRQFADSVDANDFAARRIRLGGGATVYKNYSVYVEGEFASGDPYGSTQQTSRATLAYLDVTWWQSAKIRMIQFKPAIGLEQTLLDLQSDFMERGLQQNLLDGNSAQYDRGVMVFGEPIPGAWYAVALTNGTGQNLEEKQGNVQEVQAQGKDVTTRAVLDFAQLASVDNAILHFGVGYKTGMMANSPANPYFAPNARTEARGVTFFNPAPFNGTGGNVSNIRRSYCDAEMLLSYGPVKLSAEYWEAKFAGTKTVGAASNGFAPKIDSWYVSAMWLVTGESYRDSYFDSVPQKIHPNNNFVLGKNGGWGAWEIGARYSVFDASDFNQGTNAFTGQLGATASGTTPVISVSTNKATAYTAQIKWIQNTFTRTMLDYVVTRFDTPITDNGTPRTEERAIMMRFQVDI